MDVTLILVDGKASRRDVKLTLPAVIGRSRDAALALAHPRISRQHCELYERDGALVVRDCDSLNGTFVDNRRINEAVLKPGERLTVGPLTFVAVYEQEGAGYESTEGLVEMQSGPDVDLPPQLPTPVGEAPPDFELDPGSQEPSDADTAERPGPEISAEETQPAPDAPAPADKTLGNAAEQTIGGPTEDATDQADDDDSGADNSALADFLRDLQ